MKSWNDKKKELQSIDPIRMNQLELVSQQMNAIHQRRIELGWTQQELADRAGLQQESVACIEDGGIVPCLDVVKRISFALGMKFSLHGDE